MTTVGYGDHAPTTGLGRTRGRADALRDRPLGVVTANIAAWFTRFGWTSVDGDVDQTEAPPSRIGLRPRGRAAPAATRRLAAARAGRGRGAAVGGRCRSLRAECGEASGEAPARSDRPGGDPLTDMRTLTRSGPTRWPGDGAAGARGSACPPSGSAPQGPGRPDHPDGRPHCDLRHVPEAEAVPRRHA